MKYCKLLTNNQVRENPQIISQHPSKSPLIQREFTYETGEGESNQYHVRVQGAFHSPPTSPTNFGRQMKEYRPLSPMPHTLHERPLFSNPQTSKFKQLRQQHKQDVSHAKLMNAKLRKNSENYTVYNRISSEQKTFEIKQISEEQNNYNYPNLSNKLFDNYRKVSCQLDVATFLKKPPRKQSSNEQYMITSRTNDFEITKIQNKKKGWDETNNFQLSTNYNSDQSSNADLTNSQIDNTKNNSNRKHSDNYNVKKIPSFLTNSKIYRKSFDSSEMKNKNQLSIQNFMIAKQLGKGAFGRVVLAIQKKTKMICAIKIMSKREITQSSMMEQLVRELKIQMFVNHPNVIKVYGFFDDLLHFYIIMECALDGHLSDFLSKKQNSIKEQEAAILLYQTCSAVFSLHSHSIIHRDLKPENLMMHEGIVKISDFGWSVNRGIQLRTTFCGTPIYLCPEILIGDEYDESVDIWTIGIILYEMLYRCNPFKITCQEELINILNSPIIFDESVYVSDSAKQVIRGCLRKKAVERPNIRELMLYDFVLKGHAADQFKR